MNKKELSDLMRNNRIAMITHLINVAVILLYLVILVVENPILLLNYIVVYLIIKYY